jgi:hypothetical protein
MCRDDKNRAGLPVCDVDNAQKPTRPRLPNGDARAFATRAIFDGASKDIFDFTLVDRVAVDVWFAGVGVDVIASVHPKMLPPKPSWPVVLAFHSVAVQ